MTQRRIAPHCHTAEFCDFFQNKDETQYFALARKFIHILASL